MEKDITISEAARLSGVSRQTLYNQFDSGELSRNANKRIDLSELLRVYPHIKLDLTTSDRELSSSVNDNVSNDVLSNSDALQLAVKENEIIYLKQRVEDLQERVKELSTEKAELLGLLRMQTAALPSPNDNKNNSFLAKLMGKKNR